MAILTILSSLVTWSNLKAAVVGFVVRHIAPAFIAKIKALWARVTGKVIAVETAVVTEVKKL